MPVYVISEDGDSTFVTKFDSIETAGDFCEAMDNSGYGSAYDGFYAEISEQVPELITGRYEEELSNTPEITAEALAAYLEEHGDDELSTWSVDFSVEIPAGCEDDEDEDEDE